MAAERAWAPKQVAWVCAAANRDDWVHRHQVSHFVAHKSRRNSTQRLARCPHEVGTWILRTK
jgi:hypothetical protein